MENKNNIFKISCIALFSAIAAILMIFSFPTLFLPSFYKLEFSETVSLLAGFILGPVSGMTVDFLKNILKIMFKGTATYGLGELSNFLIGCSLVVPSSIIFHKSKSKKILGPLFLGILSMMVLSAVLNIFVFLPVYSFLFSFNLNVITNANVLLYVVSTVVPFNFLKAIISCCFFVPIYSKIQSSFKF